MRRTDSHDDVTATDAPSQGSSPVGTEQADCATDPAGERRRIVRVSEPSASGRADVNESGVRR